MPPGIRGYHTIAIVVRDLDRSERFYRDVLSMGVLMRIPGRNVTMILGQGAYQFLGLWLPGAPGGPAGREHGKVHVVMAIDVADGDAWYALLRAHGVHVAKRVKETGDVHLDFDDPDGHPLELWGRTGSLAPTPGAEIPPESRHLFFGPVWRADGA
jgi:catechol 2,3-dioxygenase-like lactoylglutathione lyase family enzyme